MVQRVVDACESFHEEAGNQNTYNSSLPWNASKYGCTLQPTSLVVWHKASGVELNASTKFISLTNPRHQSTSLEEYHMQNFSVKLTPKIAEENLTRLTIEGDTVH